jgi:hypothetical protein
MDKELFCCECDEYRPYEIVRSIQVFKICGEEITIHDDTAICSTCKNELFCEELDNATLNMVYDEFSRRHDLKDRQEMREYIKKHKQG